METNEHSGEDAALADLAQRLGEKAVLLAEMADNTPNTKDEWVERVRLRAKAEGVRLALSFVEEAVRASHSGRDAV
jgi:hypothetical protein